MEWGMISWIEPGHGYLNDGRNELSLPVLLRTKEWLEAYHKRDASEAQAVAHQR
jgi:hypothetical protein